MKIVTTTLKPTSTDGVLLVVVVIALALLVWLIVKLIPISNFRPASEQESVRWIQISFIVLTPVPFGPGDNFRAKRANAALTIKIIELPAADAARPSASAAGRPPSSASASRRPWMS